MAKNETKTYNGLTDLLPKGTKVQAPGKNLAKIKVGQICPVEGCGAKITKADVEEARLNNFEGCAICFEEAGIENEHQDGNHTEAGDSACPMCPNYVNPRGEKADKVAKLNGCRCGCGAQIKGDYKQGHDAKHVSILVARALAGGSDTYSECLGELAGFPRLQAKLDRAYGNAMAKAEAKAARQAALQAKSAERELAKAEKAAKAEAKKRVLSFTEVKVGRWSYPVERVTIQGDQFLVEYTAKDGLTKEAVVGADKLK